MNKILISAICPTLNEAKYIRKVLEFFIRAEPQEKELIIVDGGSTDGTVEMVEEFARIYPKIKILQNPQKYVSFALNIAIRHAVGKYIARLDAHTEYPDDYFANCLKTSEETGAENVGGYWNTRGKFTLGKAIANAMSSTFGVGNALFRTKQMDGFVDTVPFGFWKREVFEKYGFFDETLIRNQDDEFNFRVISHGGKIYQSSKIHSTYFVRESLLALFKQYFQYGFYKPLVLKKVKSGARFRHFIPSLFVIYLLSLPISIQFELWLLPFVIYAFLNLLFSVKSRNFLQFLISLVVYPTLHISYGLGFLFGLFRALLL